MNTFLEVFVATGIFIMLLLIAAAISNAIFVVLSDFARFARALISEKVGIPRRLKANPSPTRPNDRGTLRNAAR